MKKIILVMSIVSLMLMILISGCSTTGKTFTMTAKELNDNAKFVNSNKTFSILYTSYEDGDTLIIKDTISDVTYNQTFNVTGISIMGGSDSIRGFAFQGNITDLYKNGDKVKITVHIKHVTFLYNGKNYDMEIFAEEWESQDYFIENFDTYPFKFLPTSCIEKE